MVDEQDDFTGVLDATATIICFENGKTWDCPNCGAGIGTELATRSVRCTACDSNMADHKAGSRDPREWDRDEDGRPIGLDAERASETADDDGATDETEGGDATEQTSALEW